MQQYLSYLTCLLIINSTLLSNSGSISYIKNRIDGWDYESVYVIIDDAKWSQHYLEKEGTQLCGS